jgi:hypothetical protein
MLELVLTGSAVSLLNNERGFSVRDVRGISDIGKSKKKGKAGYTGGSTLCLMCGTEWVRREGYVQHQRFALDRYLRYRQCRLHRWGCAPLN